PYADEAAADAQVNTEASRAAAYKAHQESVVLLKNNGALPLTAERMAGKKVYVEMMMRTDYSEEELKNMALSGSRADPRATIAAFADALKADHPDWAFVDDYHGAD